MGNFRPIGNRALVMFPQGEWAREEGSDYVGQVGIAGAPFRMDALVVAVGNGVEGFGPGDTVYGDPRKGRVLVIDETMYHIMEAGDLVMKATAREER